MDDPLHSGCLARALDAEGPAAVAATGFVHKGHGVAIEECFEAQLKGYGEMKGYDELNGYDEVGRGIS